MNTRTNTHSHTHTTFTSAFSPKGAFHVKVFEKTFWMLFLCVTALLLMP